MPTFADIRRIPAEERLPIGRWKGDNRQMSNKMNEVMKVLTIMASIFIPLTFIAGIYGMNFDHMPELHWEHGYPMVWGIMIVLFIGMMIYFKRKNWL